MHYSSFGAEVDGVNRTLQTLLRYVTDSLNELSTYGLKTAGGDNESCLYFSFVFVTFCCFRFFLGVCCNISLLSFYHLGLSKERMRFYIMTIRGDWKFLKQCLNLQRNPYSENICYHCLASKGNHNPTMNFTDLSDEAGWRETVFSCPPPWRRPPAFQQLQYFDCKKIGLDLLHIWHLGVCRDLTLGSIKKTLVCQMFLKEKDNANLYLIVLFFQLRNWFLFATRIGGAMSTLIKAGYFGRGGVKVRLCEATKRLKKWCKSTSRSTALKQFTQDNLVLKGQKTPDFWFKLLFLGVFLFK